MLHLVHPLGHHHVHHHMLRVEREASRMLRLTGERASVGIDSGVCCRLQLSRRAQACELHAIHDNTDNICSRVRERLDGHENVHEAAIKTKAVPTSD